MRKEKHPMREHILDQMQNVVKEQFIVLNPKSAISELIDSVTFVKMVVALESEFNFEFDDEMLLISKFPVVEDMIQYVEMKISSHISNEQQITI